MSMLVPHRLLISSTKPDFHSLQLDHLDTTSDHHARCCSNPNCAISIAISSLIYDASIPPIPTYYLSIFDRPCFRS